MTALDGQREHPATQRGDYDDEIDLLELFQALWQGKWLIILLTTIAGGIGVIYSLSLPNIYRAEVLLAPASENKQGGLSALAAQYGGLASLAGVSLPSSGDSSVQEAMALLKSRKFAAQFINSNNLLPILFEESWDTVNQQWKVPEAGILSSSDAAGDEIVEPSMWQAYKRYQAMVSISQDKKDNLITLAIEWTDPVLATQWVEDLVERINTYIREEKRIEAERNMAFLEQQVKQTSVVEFQRVLFTLIENQAQTIMLANVRDEFVFKVLDPAVVPEEKVKPKRSLICMLAVLLGGMLSCCIVLFRHFISNKKE